MRRAAMRLLALYPLLLLLWISAAAAFKTPLETLGIPPQDEAYYSGGVIKCRDGSGKFARDKLNDDFCDCPDGTDEPGTSACPEGKFYCQNAGHSPITIFSSRVNDGICDCCDGSDEYDSNVTCKNTCWEAGKAAREKLKKKVATYKSGVVIGNQEIGRAKEAFAKDEAELTKLKGEEKMLQGLVDKLKEQKKLIEKAEEEERLKKEKEEKRLKEEADKQAADEKKTQESSQGVDSHETNGNTQEDESKEVNSGDASIVEKPQLQLFKPDSSSSGKCSEYSNTESSDDVGKQEICQMSDEDEFHFYDTRQSFSDRAASPDLKTRCLNNGNEAHKFGEVLAADKMNDYLLSSSKRRSKLPEPVEKEKSVSLWSMIKDNVGKDLTRVCLPVYFNEPLSSLQKCFEELEYSHLLDLAYECGLRGNGLMRILYVAAFAVSGYSSTDSRPCKPFNPLLGETYEADFPEKGIRFFSEKVSHHPMSMACHCEGKGWKFWGDSNLKSKFWGQSIQLDPCGVLTLEFDDGETFQWSKVTTSINNLIIGRVYCHHHGTMNISGNRQYSCKLMFKEQSFLERNPRQVQGFVKDADGTKVASLMGKWDESMCCVISDEASKVNSHITHQSAGATLLWQKNEPPANPTRYNLSSFAITLNELTPGLKEKLPPTDSRLRPDQRHLENGEYEKANSEKLRLETRQRISRKMQESGWKPRWFQRDTEDGTYRYVGGYWEAREQRKWVGCNDIFGNFSDNSKPRESTLYTSASV